MMRILYVINSLDAGGAEKLLCNFLNKITLTHPENEYSLLLLTGIIKVADRKFFSDRCIKLHIINSNIYNPINIVKILKLLNRTHFDIVHTHLFPSQYWVIMARYLSRSKAKLVFTEHSNKNKRIDNSLFRGIERRIYHKYDRIVAITSNVSNAVQRFTDLNSNTIKVISNGVDLNKYKDASPSNDFQKHKIQGKKIILMVARFAAPKLQHLLIKSMKYLDDDHVIAFVGEGLLLEDAIKLANDFGYAERILFLGLRNDVPGLMKSCDINVLCSEFEGMSGVALEAMASGMPFIGSDVPGINDIVGTNLSLFKNDERTIANKINEVLNDLTLREKIIEENLAAVGLFSMEFMIEQHLSLYNKLLSS